MECPYCKSQDTMTYYHASMPNILAACPKEMHSSVKLLPVEASLCKNCGLGFNSIKLSNDDLKFIYDNYCYISPMHGIGCSKYEGMISTLQKFCKIKDKIVEIGCSEGYLLNKLKIAGYQDLTGIEPGPQAVCAEQLGIHVINDYFTENTFLTNDIDVFFLMHVFEHFEDPFNILDIIVTKLSSSGKIIIEVPNFDGYCHQHLFYYNVPFFVRLSKDKKLKIAELLEEKGSLRVVFVRENNMDFNGIACKEDINNIINKAKGIQFAFQKNIQEIELLLKQNIGKTVYWWGAGSASTILINQVNQEVLKKIDLIIVDGDANKIGNYIPGVNLKVNSFEIMKNTTSDVLIIASELFEEIKKVMKKNSISAKTIKTVY